MFLFLKSLLCFLDVEMLGVDCNAHLSQILSHEIRVQVQEEVLLSQSILIEFL